MIMIILRPLLVIALISIASGSHKGEVFVPEITLNHPEAKVTVRVDPKSAKLEAIEVVFGEQKISLPKSELVGIDQVDTSTVRIVTSYMQGNEESRSRLTSTLIVKLEYGPTKYHVDKKLERMIPVRSVATFTFDSSKYTIRNTATPKGDFENKWILFEKFSGEKEEGNGAHKPAKSPY